PWGRGKTVGGTMAGKAHGSESKGARGARIAGRPLADIRAILRCDTGEGISLDDARKVLHREDRDTVEQLLGNLVSEGFVVEEKENLWRCTSKGRDLQWVSRSRLSRAKAEQLVATVVTRAEQINSDDTYALCVSAIVAFGSFITDKPMIGDVDLALEL